MATNTPITVSAPGKIHFLGEHVVVHGKPALLAAIDKRCTVSLTPYKNTQIEIISKIFDQQLLLSQENIENKQKDAQKKWEKFLENNDVSLLVSLTKNPLDYAVIAIGEALKYYNKKLPSGFSITIDSDISVGSGLGSSAALAVTIAAAVSLFLTSKIDKEAVFAIAFATEQKKHGRPSGGDPATVLHGGMVWFRKETDDLKIMKSVQLVFPKSLAKNFFLIDSGKPQESTGEMIAHVREFMGEDTELARDIFDIQEMLTRNLLDAIRDNDEKGLIKILKMGERNLETMGAVSPYVKKIIRAIENAGGAAKISGGGGKTKGTGTLLVYHIDKEKLQKVVKSYALPIMQTHLGVEGLRIEK